MPLHKTAQRAVQASLVGVLALAGCSSADTVDPVNPLGYHDPIVVRPMPDSPDVSNLTVGLNNAGYDLFQYVASQGDEDVVLSPLSIGLAFGMLDLGATGTVAEALEDLFAYPIDGDARWSAFNALDQGVVSEPEPVAPPKADEWPEPVLPTVRIANRMFRDIDFTATDEYAEGLARWFGAGVEPLLLREDSEGARRYINEWVSEKTNDLIPDLIPAGSITPDTVMVLVNALYLKAQWEEPFDEWATDDGDFTLLDGSTTTVPLMHQYDFYAAAVFGDGYTAIELPYTGDLSMLVVLPDEGQYGEIESSLGSEFVAEVDVSLTGMATDLYFPRFTSEANFNLREAIENGLGVSGLFYVADLGGIGPGIWVDDAVHAAKIIVDEEGTEAAAATAIMMAGAAPIEPKQLVEIRVDRPFLYLIRDGSTGGVLFVGRVLDPSE